MCDTSDNAFTVTSSLELLAAVASLPEEHVASHVLGIRTEVSELSVIPSSKDLNSNNGIVFPDSSGGLPNLCENQPTSTVPEDVEFNGKKYLRDAKAIRRVNARIGYIRRRLMRCAPRLSLDPKPLSDILGRVEKDLVLLFGRKLYHMTKSLSSIRNSNGNKKPRDDIFCDQSTQTSETSHPASLDLDYLNPTVSPVDYAVSVTLIHESEMQSGSNSSNLPPINSEIEASGHLLDTILLNLSESAVDDAEEPLKTSLPSSFVPQIQLTPVEEFNPEKHQLTHTFLNMFWNTFPALSSESGHLFLRLADIAAIALPAKDSSILKQRCNKLGVTVYSCTDLQRNFLVKYRFGSPCRSGFMIDAHAAKKLIASYCQDKLKEHGLTVEDMQIVVLSKEESDRLISSRLNICSTKYDNATSSTCMDRTSAGENAIVLRHRTIATNPAVNSRLSRKRNISFTTSNTVPSIHFSLKTVPENDFYESVIPDARTKGEIPKKAVGLKTETKASKKKPKSATAVPSRFARVLLPGSTLISVRAIGKIPLRKVSCSTGTLVPHLFVVPYAQCVKCVNCLKFFTPLGFTKHCGGARIKAVSLSNKDDKTLWRNFCSKLREFQATPK